jgi:hypothetical protein
MSIPEVTVSRYSFKLFDMQLSQYEDVNTTTRNFFTDANLALSHAFCVSGVGAGVHLLLWKKNTLCHLHVASYNLQYHA